MALKAIRSRPGDWAAASAKESTGGQTVWSARVRSGYGVQQGEHQKPWGIGQSLRRWRWIGQRLPVTHRARNLPLQERRRETYPRVFDALRRLCLAHVAVGAGVTSCPPRRSRRAAFCFAAPSVSAPGSCRRSDATGVRGLGGPSSSGPWVQAVGDMRVPALCPEHELALALPSTGRLPSTLSATRLSAGVVRGFIGTLQPSDSSYLPIRLRLLTFPNRPGIAVATAGGMRSPRFRHDP
jgi:hypothetical protein